jgi:4-diphosphocytidyl-2-C-methyl-D-erythritol kinase
VAIEFKKITVHPPAKINIGLKVLGKRADGYHELETIMVPVDLFDNLELELGDIGVDMICDGFSVPDTDENLAAMAAAKFFSATGIKKGIRIRLKKRIPVAAGLGGGSSDAALTLMALNEMFGTPLREDELSTLALDLGADVPFFLAGGACIARGIGEILEPIANWPDFWYVIVVPPFAVSTAWVYGNLKSPGIKDSGRGEREIWLTEKAHKNILNILAEKRFNAWGMIENDLEGVTIPHFPVIEEIKKALLAEGAVGALMSGSGPSVFGVFATEGNALKGSKSPALKGLGDVFLVKGMS